MIQVRKTVAESEQLLAKMNDDLPPLIGELRAMSHNMNESDQTSPRGSRACCGPPARGRGSGGIGSTRARCREGFERNDVTNVASVVAGFKAATQVVKERFRDKGGHHNGG